MKYMTKFDGELRGLWLRISTFTVISGFPSPLHALDYRFPIMEHIGFQYTLVRRWEFEVTLPTPSGV